MYVIGIDHLTYRLRTGCSFTFTEALSELRGVGNARILLDDDAQTLVLDNAGSDTDETDVARRLGSAAYHYSETAAPGASAALLDLIGAVPVGQPRTLALMRAYSRGWQAEADKAWAAAERLSPPCQTYSAAGTRRTA